MNGGPQMWRQVSSKSPRMHRIDLSVLVVRMCVLAVGCGVKRAAPKTAKASQCGLDIHTAHGEWTKNTINTQSISQSVSHSGLFTHLTHRIAPIVTSHQDGTRITRANNRQPRLIQHPSIQPATHTHTGSNRDGQPPTNKSPYTNVS